MTSQFLSPGCANLKIGHYHIFQDLILQSQFWKIAPLEGTGCEILLSVGYAWPAIGLIQIDVFHLLYHFLFLHCSADFVSFEVFWQLVQSGLEPYFVQGSLLDSRFVQSDHQKASFVLSHVEIYDSILRSELKDTKRKQREVQSQNELTYRLHLIVLLRLQLRPAIVHIMSMSFPQGSDKDYKNRVLVEIPLLWPEFPPSTQPRWLVISYTGFGACFLQSLIFESQGARLEFLQVSFPKQYRIRNIGDISSLAQALSLSPVLMLILCSLTFSTSPCNLVMSLMSHTPEVGYHTHVWCNTTAKDERLRRGSYE